MRDTYKDFQNLYIELFLLKFFTLYYKKIFIVIGILNILNMVLVKALNRSLTIQTYNKRLLIQK